MDVSEAKKDKAIQLFMEAWEERRLNLESAQAERIRSLEVEAAQLRKELEISSLKISQLEEQREDLEMNIREASAQNSKFEHIKAALINTLNEPAPRKTERSPARTHGHFESPTNKASYTKAMSKTQHERPSEEFSDPPNKLIDGKKFFAEARERLSFEQFSKFLGFVKQLNDKVIDSEKAIKEVGALFGSKNRDLYQGFVQLLSKKANK